MNTTHFNPHILGPFFVVPRGLELEIPRQIEKYHSWPEYQVAKDPTLSAHSLRRARDKDDLLIDL